jgi:adenylate cyclase
VFTLLNPNQFLSRPLDRVIVKGKTQPVLIHELFDADPEPVRLRKQRLLPSFLQGLQLFYARQWQESRLAFKDCLEIDPGDVVSQIYWERSHHFALQPPPEEWDGCFEMQHK